MKYFAILTALVCWFLEAQALYLSGNQLHYRSEAWAPELIRRSGRGTPRSGSPSRSPSPDPRQRSGGTGSPVNSPSPSRSRAGPSNAADQRSRSAEGPRDNAQIDLSMNGPGKVDVRTFERTENQRFSFEQRTKTDSFRVSEGRKLHKSFSSPHRLELEVKTKPGGSHVVTATGAFVNMATKTSSKEASSAFLDSYSSVHGRRLEKAQDGSIALVKNWSGRQSGAAVSSSLDGKGKTKVNVDNRIRTQAPKPDTPPQLPSNHPLAGASSKNRFKP